MPPPGAEKLGSRRMLMSCRAAAAAAALVRRTKMHCMQHAHRNPTTCLAHRAPGAEPGGAVSVRAQELLALHTGDLDGAPLEGGRQRLAGLPVGGKHLQGCKVRALVVASAVLRAMRQRVHTCGDPAHAHTCGGLSDREEPRLSVFLNAPGLWSKNRMDAAPASSRLLALVLSLLAERAGARRRQHQQQRLCDAACRHRLHTCASKRTRRCRSAPAPPCRQPLPCW